MPDDISSMSTSVEDYLACCQKDGAKKPTRENVIFYFSKTLIPSAGLKTLTLESLK